MISSAYLGSGIGKGGNGGASGGKQASGGIKVEWTDSDEPTGPTLHKTDITVLCGDVLKLNEKAFTAYSSAAHR